MGTFAETAIVDYRLSFAEQGKKTSVFRFYLQQTNGSLSFPFFVCRKQKEIAVIRLRNSGNMETWKHGGMET
jgi:hypothetical protein